MDTFEQEHPPQVKKITKERLLFLLFQGVNNCLILVPWVASSLACSLFRNFHVLRHSTIAFFLFTMPALWKVLYHSINNLASPQSRNEVKPHGSESWGSLSKPPETLKNTFPNHFASFSGAFFWSHPTKKKSPEMQSTSLWGYAPGEDLPSTPEVRAVHVWAGPSDGRASRVGLRLAPRPTSPKICGLRPTSASTTLLLQ